MIRDYQPRKVLLTGAAGFICSNVACYLVQRHSDITFVGLDKFSYCSNLDNVTEIEHCSNWSMVVADLTQKDAVMKVFEREAKTGVPFDTVLHFAAYTHVDHSFEDSIQFTLNNVLGTHVLLEACRQHQVSRLIHVSTDEVYGSQEHISRENSILDPTNPYAATKAAAEHLVKSYHHSFGLPVIITRGNNVYGPRQFPEKVIPRFILRLLAGQACQIQGSGKQLRSFLHVDDVCTAFETILFKGVIGEIYNIGTEDEHNILELAERLIELVHSSDNESPANSVCAHQDALPALHTRHHYANHIQYIEDRHFNDQRYAIHSDKLQALGWKPQISFDEGLRRTFAWYRVLDLNNYKQWQQVVHQQPDEKPAEEAA